MGLIGDFGNLLNRIDCPTSNDPDIMRKRFAIECKYQFFLNQKRRLKWSCPVDTPFFWKKGALY